MRGAAAGFKLDTLLKLADVKGTDRKTSLLHFVVSQVGMDGLGTGHRVVEGRWDERESVTRLARIAGTVMNRYS